MDYDYTARWQRLNLEFANSPDNADAVLSVRVVVNDEVRITQCRDTMVFSTQIDVNKLNIITIENLTYNTKLIIQKVTLGLLSITEAMDQFAITRTRDTNEQFACYINDLGSNDIMTIQFEQNVFKKLLPYFTQGVLVPLV